MAAGTVWGVVPIEKPLVPGAPMVGFHPMAGARRSA